ncbi:LiaF transmembrane domain-containing protein [Anaerotalea alkaliphila]|uniref:Cell wall-active antibiotics response protein n=1 Tax=Anaerotalea alkaliphila TaxID=2662126 RepID=A0A7X5HUV6_9FIRM|nr:DUF5668 domain-containing protein [Anaerotalea alkaliphila]NDL67100.1 cell wall-active antibiotics response protein [Anaerotalea alkaliphila]
MAQRRVLGLVVLFFGILFLLDQLGMGVDLGRLIAGYWPLLLVAVGIIQLAGGSGFRLSGILLLGAGILLQLEKAGVLALSVRIWELVLPVAVILLGVHMLLPRAKGVRVRSEDFVNQMALFSGVEVKNASRNFQGADLLVLFGGMELDLRGGAIGAERPAKIQAFVGFGGADILVPEGWKVRVSGLPLFGGWSNKTDPSGKEGDADLVVQLIVLFGGCEVKNKI